MSTREYKRLAEASDGESMNTEPNSEMVRVQREAQDNNVAVNGWQKGIEDMPGFALVTDNTTGATFAVKSGEPLTEALDRVQARMAGNYITTHEEEEIRTD